MKYFTANALSLASQQTDCLVFGLYDDGTLAGSASEIDQISNGALQHVIDSGDLKGKAGQALMLHKLNGINSPRVLLIGFGKQDKLTENDFNTATATMAKHLNESGARSAICDFCDIKLNSRSIEWKIRQTIISSATALYQYTQTKSSHKPTATPLDSLGFIVPTAQASFEQAISEGSAIGQGMNLARELGNLPGNICTPTYLSEQALSLDKQYSSITTNVLEEADMAELGMGSLLSVSRGSREPAKLITLEYNGAGDTNPIVLVGKGVTFDAGGISLKPGAGMDEMKYDMCGSASVLGTIKAIAELKLAVNLVVVIPTTENLPDGDASKPGDIVTSMSGKTIEVLNTDAEGRLILCDALTYSERFNPEIVIDIATLTGAIIVGLGSVTTGLMANNQKLADALLTAGNDSYDRTWQLPLFDDYQKQLDSNFADIANIGGKEAGSITAACFLSRFTENVKWAHLDIAGTAWNSGKAKGATGRPVPLLVQFILNHIAQ